MPISPDGTSCNIYLPSFLSITIVLPGRTPRVPGHRAPTHGTTADPRPYPGGIPNYHMAALVFPLIFLALCAMPIATMA